MVSAFEAFAYGYFVRFLVCIWVREIGMWKKEMKRVCTGERERK